MVQVRAHGGLAPATVEAIDGGTDGIEGPGIRIRLQAPLTGVARGQAAVVYLPDAVNGDLVVGSGRIVVTGSVPGDLVSSTGA
jgi:tRNA-specific 2-thiouridylase